MKFAEFAQYLQDLESTSGRNDMTIILSRMFAAATPEDAKMLAYLSQGMLGPIYDNPDTGVADKMALKAIASALEIDLEKVVEAFKKQGDLGITIQGLSNNKDQGLTVKDVFERLIEITQVSGSGSQEIKQKMMGDLFNNLEPLSSKYVVRILLHKMRTGFSDMTVLDSLSWMISGDKSQRKALESMYNVRADLGELAYVIKQKGKPQHLDPKIGTPILMAKCERASSANEVWERNGECAVEYKLDGLRIQAHKKGNKITLFSRGLENMTEAFPDVVEGLKAQILGDAVVEGEVIGLDKSGKFLDFQKTMQRKRKYGINEKAFEIPLQMYLFDVLVGQEQILLEKPNEYRWSVLEKITKSGPIVKLMNRIVAKNEQDIDGYFKKALADRTEGIIAKKLTGTYQAGNRDFNWIKMKSVLDSVDVVVMGYTSGEGKRTEFGIGEFLVGVYDSKNDSFSTITKVGSGATDDEWRKLESQFKKLVVDKKPDRYNVHKQYECDFWIKPEIVLEIQANEITVSPTHSAGYALRFPRLISWREKRPEDATTVLEIESMYTNIKKGGDH